MSAPQTNSQKMAQAAYRAIDKRNPQKEYVSFAREFPSLVHSCGLAQSVAFARARSKSKEDHHQHQYIIDLAAVLKAAGHPEIASREHLEAATRDLQVGPYLRLCRDALLAATWLKRYAEAKGTTP
jgi:CRISPR-associated protein Cmr5